jgi:hypothetical protein
VNQKLIDEGRTNLSQAFASKLLRSGHYLRARD